MYYIYMHDVICLICICNLMRMATYIYILLYTDVHPTYVNIILYCGHSCQGW